MGLKPVLFICAITCLLASQTRGQALYMQDKKGHIPHGMGKRDNYEEFTTRGSVNRAAGYVVYNQDTIKGIISLNKFDIYLEQPVNAEYSYYYHFKPHNLKLKTVVVYNTDNKQLCLTRVKRNSRRLMRLIHEGKLNIYDDRYSYIYKTTQIDKNLIVVAYNGRVKELGSFFTAGTKRSLISYVNNAYNLDIKSKSISWSELLLTVDKLE